MTENKRFKIVDEQFISYYGGTGYKISNEECDFWLWHNKNESQKVCDKLNSILDENRQLKQSYKEFEDECQSTFNAMNREQNDLYRKNFKLKEENEQLKKENYELHKRLGDFEPFEDHIKERTSKTSVNDIIGLVKTDEPIDIVELEKELK